MYRLFDSIPISAVNSALRLCFFSPAAYIVCTANLHPAAQHLPTVVLENQLDTTKPQLALVQKKRCCYQTSYMSHLESASCIGGDRKKPWAPIQKEQGTAHAFYTVQRLQRLQQSGIMLCTPRHTHSFLFFVQLQSVQNIVVYSVYKRLQSQKGCAVASVMI